MKTHDKLARSIAERGWSQGDLLKRLPSGSKATLSRWFSGENEPKLSDAFHLARVLELPLSYLADDSQDQPPAPEFTEAERFVVQVIRDLRLTREEAVWRLGHDPRIAGLAGDEPDMVRKLEPGKMPVDVGGPDISTPKRRRKAN